jgi:hypothetical protein
MAHKRWISICNIIIYLETKFQKDPLYGFRERAGQIFILAAILKILKTKSTTMSDDLFLCQVSKGSAVRFPRNVPDKIDAESAESGRIMIIRNRAKTKCLANFVWEP